MNKSASGIAIAVVALVMALVTPDDAFMRGELIGMPGGDGDDQTVAEPWYRNTFVKLRAAETSGREGATRAAIGARRGAGAGLGPEPPPGGVGVHPIDP